MSGLEDKYGVEDICNVFIDLKERGKVILIVTHSPSDIEILCDDVQEMDRGVLE